MGRSTRVALVGVTLFAAAVWNGIFDFLVSRGEREYFWAQARSESGAGPPVVLHDMMAESVRYAALVASWWAAVTFAAGAVLIWYLRRDSRP